MKIYDSPLKTQPDHHLRCFENPFGSPSCGSTYGHDEIRYECDCGELLEVVIDLDPLKSVRPGRWRKVLRERAEEIHRPGARGINLFREFLPITDPSHSVSVDEGWAPLSRADSLAETMSFEKGKLWLKRLGENPTGSFKDYGMAMLLTKARELHGNGVLDEAKVACASTGNTSSSLAAYSSRAGFDCYILVPEDVSEAKLVQTAFYGAEILKIDGNFDDAMDLVSEISAEGLVYLGNSKNPYRIEGQKTIMMETLVQRNFDADFNLVFPIGNAGNAAAFTKLLREWKEVGIIDSYPRTFGVQAEGANPLATKFQTGEYEKIENPQTSASAIQIGDPISGEKAELGIKECGGDVIDVSDDEIFRWQKRIGERTGIGCEPASATSAAGANRLLEQGKIQPDEDTVCVLTGNLLKDVRAVKKHHEGLIPDESIEPRKSELVKAIQT